MMLEICTWIRSNLEEKKNQNYLRKSSSGKFSKKNFHKIISEMSCYCNNGVLGEG